MCQNKSCTPVLTAALFTVAEPTWVFSNRGMDEGSGANTLSGFFHHGEERHCYFVRKMDVMEDNYIR